jgi:hypothetical protein
MMIDDDDDVSRRTYASGKPAHAMVFISLMSLGSQHNHYLSSDVVSMK